MLKVIGLIGLYAVAVSLVMANVFPDLMSENSQTHDMVLTLISLPGVFVFMEWMNSKNDTPKH